MSSRAFARCVVPARHHRRKERKLVDLTERRAHGFKVVVKLSGEVRRRLDLRTAQLPGGNRMRREFHRGIAMEFPWIELAESHGIADEQLPDAELLCTE